MSGREGMRLGATGRRAVVTIALFLQAIPGSAGAATATLADTRKALHTTRTGTAPVIDGVCAEAVWSQADAVSDFTQQQPEEARPATERTELRVLYDDSALYVQARMLDSDPSAIAARLSRRDREVEADRIRIMLDSRHDRRTAYVFELNAAGVKLDGQMFDDTEYSSEWDGVWEGAAAIAEYGWCAEFAIPLSILRFRHAPSQEWGLNVQRYISRKKEIDQWVYIPTTARGEVSRAGVLTGLVGLRPERVFELRPYVAAALTGTAASGNALLGMGPDAGSTTSLDIDVGLDLKLGITSDLTIDATVNPDFGQVEADEVVLNLSRYETFLAEKRPFFTEGAELFRTPLQLFYSRRIGQSRAGVRAGQMLAVEDAPVRVEDAPAVASVVSAAKLTGSLSQGLGIGTLGAVTAAEEATVTDEMGRERTITVAPQRAFLATRARYSPGGASYLGAMGTAALRLGTSDWRAATEHDAVTAGIDGQVVSGDGVWRLTGQGVASLRMGGASHAQPDGTVIGPGDVGWGLEALGSRIGEHWMMAAQYRGLSPALDINDMGFSSRRNQHYLQVAGGYRETRARGLLRHYEVKAAAISEVDFDLVSKARQLISEGTWEYRNFMSQRLYIGTDLPRGWDAMETGDGARLETAPRVFGGIGLVGDSRGLMSWQASAAGYREHAGRGYGGTMSATASLTLPRLELSVAPSAGVDRGALRFRGCIDAGAACTTASDTRDYLFAHLDSGYLSLTTRGMYTFSTELTLQVYAQLFMARGEYADYREITTMGAQPYIYRGALAASAHTGDSDGDGVADDDFQQTSLHLNAVLRWEPAPGSALYAVYTREQQAGLDLGGARPQLSPAGLSTGPTSDAILLKLVLFGQ